GATMEKNVVLSTTGGGGSSGGGGGGGSVTAKKYTWKVAVNAKVNNTSLTGGSTKTITGDAYKTSNMTLKDFVNTVAEDSQNAAEYALGQALNRAINGGAGVPSLLDAQGKLLPMTINTEVEVRTEDILGESADSVAENLTNEGVEASAEDVENIMSSISTTTEKQNEAAAEKKAAATEAHATAKDPEATEEARAAAVEELKTQYQEAEKQVAIMDEITTQYDDKFVTDPETGKVTDVDISYDKAQEKIDEMGITGITITEENFEQVKQDYIDQYNNLHDIMEQQQADAGGKLQELHNLGIIDLDEIGIDPSDLSVGSLPVVYRVMSARAANTITMRVPVTVNIGTLLFENENALWNQVDKIFVAGDQYVAALKAAMPVSDFLVKVGEDDYYLKTGADSYGGDNFVDECAAYLADKLSEIEPLAYDVAAKGEVDPSNQTYPEARLQEMFVNRLNLDIKKAYMSNSDGTNDNTEVANPNYAAFVAAFRNSGDTMTVKDAIDILGVDCLEVDKEIWGGNLERFVRSAMNNVNVGGESVDKEKLIEQVMNRLEKYTLTVEATLDWNAPITAQQ
ncbi:MAG: hypothetical protein ACI3XZ_02730, partial [Butyricicoccus sp.]